MKVLYKALLLALLQVLIVSSLGAKLLLDRAWRPRTWVKTAPVDPELPIRGRYVSLRLEVPARGFPPPPTVPRPAVRRGYSEAPEEREARHQWEQWSAAWSGYWAEVLFEDGRLVARPAKEYRGELATLDARNGEVVAILREPVAFFIPEHVPDPSRRAEGEELWVEVTIPKKGPPRPIRLGVKRGETLTPLELD